MLAIIFFAILCVVEARLELITIEMKDPNLPDYPHLNQDEHRWSAVYYAAITIFVAYISFVSISGKSWKFFPALAAFLICRRIFFEHALKIFRGRPLKLIEGDQPLDKFSRKIFGVTGGLKELALCIVLLTLLILIIQIL